MATTDGTASWTRRQFVQAGLGSALVATACSDLGFEDDEEPSLFDGPRIDEEEFLALNSRYYDAGIHQPTQFPYRAIVGGMPVAESDPISIAFRLQYLLDDLRRSAEVDSLLVSLLNAQISDRPPRNFRNMIPRLALTSSGAEPATLEYSFTDNALLSSRVAMAAQAFNGTDTGNKALTFLDRQKLGYNQALNGAQSGFLPTFAHAGLFGVDPQGLDLLFGGYYESAAFVLAYFIGDTQVIADPSRGLDTWGAMINAQATFSDRFPASTTGPLNIESPLSRNGSAYQYFHSLLGIEPEALSPTLYNGLYNALFSYLDAATYDRLPGIYSASPHEGGFLLDNGLNRLAARQRRHASQELFATVDALAAAMRLFPEDADNREIIRGWIGLYGTVEGAVSQQGYYGGIDKEGAPVNSVYARQNGAMILFNSETPSLLDAFLAERGRPSMRELIGQITLTHQGEPIERVAAHLPLPPRYEKLFTPIR